MIHLGTGPHLGASDAVRTPVSTPVSASPHSASRSRCPEVQRRVILSLLNKRNGECHGHPWQADVGAR